MKKQAVSMLALSLVCGAAFALPETKTASADSFGFAEYVSEEQAPEIDGQIDDVWYDAPNTLYVQNKNQQGQATADVTILWNETGLYFLAEIYDATLVSSDMCNFWVSESYYESEQSLAYPFVDGAYYVCLTPENQLYVYDAPEAYEGRPVDMTGFYTSAVSEDSYGYIIEMYVPLYGELPLEKGNSIGFDISLDDYEEECTVGNLDYRKGYTNWAGLGAYWEDPTALGKILLTDIVAENGVAPTPTPDPTPSNSANSSVSSTTSSVAESGSNSEESSSSGCTSSVAFAPLAGALAVAGVALIKKKRQ